MTYYVCVENNSVVSVLNYEPNVPSDVTVVKISDEENQKITDGVYRFDTTTLKTVPVDQSVLDAEQTRKDNIPYQEFLKSTDWKILRHVRQKALGIETSLTEEEYILLEQQRQQAADNIKPIV